MALPPPPLPLEKAALRLPTLRMWIPEMLSELPPTAPPMAASVVLDRRRFPPPLSL